jgi:hypothetical protein
MSSQRECDICGRSEGELFVLTAEGFVELEALEIDADGLWICGACRAEGAAAPAKALDPESLSNEIRALVGKSAGAICSTLDLPYKPPYRSLIDAAHRIAYDQDLYMSAWSFVTQWMDGTTVWHAEDGSASALVSRDGSVEIKQR